MILRKIENLTLCVSLFLLVSGCAGGISSGGKPANGEIRGSYTLPVPFVMQDSDRCAVAALRSVFGYYGIDAPDMDGIYRKEIGGTRVITLVNYSTRYMPTRASRLDYDRIAEMLLSGNPLILLRAGHYYVVKGFVPDEKKLVASDGFNENVVMDAPASGWSEDIAIIFNGTGTVWNDPAVVENQ